MSRASSTPKKPSSPATPSTKKKASSARSRPAGARLTAATADRHDLYQRSVQDPRFEVRFLQRAFRRHTGREPMRLREDFCGTALLCAKWVASHPERTVVGLDIDREVLDWGTAHNLAPLGSDAARVTLLEQDVTVPTAARFEAICAYNYSYSVFHTRAALRTYFEAAYRSLEDDGIFSLDALGGWEAQQVLTEKREVDGFRYVWDQASYDAVTSRYECHISFEFPDRTKLPRAFVYDWRLWQLAELRELLTEVGFVSVDAYWEGVDREGAASGTFHKVTRPVGNDPGWNAYLVAKKSASAEGSADALEAAARNARAAVRGRTR